MTWALASIGVLLIGFAVVSDRLEAYNLSPAMFFTTTGLAFGPGLGLLDLPIGGREVQLIAEATLTLVLFTDASRISLRRLRREYTVPLRLLGLGLPLTIAAGAGAGVLLLPGVGILEALVLAVMLACTDAALGQAVVTDRRVPSRVRQGLNVESGLNDGLCVPLFVIAVALTEATEQTVTAWSAVTIVVEEVGFGLVGGIVAALLAGMSLRFAARHHTISRPWVQIPSVGAATTAAGTALALGGSIFIAAFTAGLVFSALRPDHGPEVTYLVDQSGELLNAVTFIVFGAVILAPALRHLSWQLLVYALSSLTVVRVLPVAAAMIGTGARRPTLAYLGWFGPRGLASIVFAVTLLDEATLEHGPTLLAAVVVTVALSIFLHGVTARPLTVRYARWYGEHPAGARPRMETVSAAEHRWRTPWLGHHGDGAMP
ncbi:cation:proton antiporter [Actinomycetospora cinnamomea]|uniref:Sodium/proton antiporter (CPA1 family) n=1 Tax=Actinomycetospora cinnamomea TaxID=663609 RepID=A0A2U1F3R1_9PSEU|nr:cation:proton antiporter [Actinomycetospora cinnamomea]PVZ06814.1 sodium/proton antiporter (CPA1 family) [Actinomycetospora cinnamomea]